MKRLLPILVAAVMLVLSIGCTSNDAEVEQLRSDRVRPHARKASLWHGGLED